MAMYFNLQLGNFHVVLGKLAAEAAKEKPVSSRINTRDSEPEEIFLDDESKLRYRSYQ
jgi:hypothetical protein